MAVLLLWLSRRASKHTSVGERLIKIEQESAAADRLLAPIAGIRGLGALGMTQTEYLRLVGYTGRQIRADKRSAINVSAPAELARPGDSPET